MYARYYQKAKETIPCIEGHLVWRETRDKLSQKHKKKVLSAKWEFLIDTVLVQEPAEEQSY